MRRFLASVDNWLIIKAVVDGIMPTEKTKEELIEFILQKDKQVDELAAREVSI